jgi:hypothetical protein
VLLLAKTKDPAAWGRGEPTRLVPCVFTALAAQEESVAVGLVLKRQYTTCL